MKTIEDFKTFLLDNNFTLSDEVTEFIDDAIPFYTYEKNNISVTIDDKYITVELPNININRYPDDIILPFGEQDGHICINYILEQKLIDNIMTFINDPYSWITDYLAHFSKILGKCTHNNYGYFISNINIPNYITLSNQLDTYINIFTDFISFETTIQPRLSQSFYDVCLADFNYILEQTMRNEWDEQPVYVNNEYKGTLLELTLNMDQTCYHMSKDEFYKFCETL